MLSQQGINQSPRRVPWHLHPFYDSFAYRFIIKVNRRVAQPSYRKQEVCEQTFRTNELDE